MLKSPKICLPIVGKSKEEILNQAKEISALPVELAEWRVDFFKDIENILLVCQMISELKSILPKQELIFTFRSEREGGEQLAKEVSYSELLSSVIEDGRVDYVDVEMYGEEDVVDHLISLAEQKQMKVIGSYHDFSKTPGKEEIEKRLFHMKKAGANIGKIAVMPNSEEDVENLLHATEFVTLTEPNFPVITMAMGELGKKSRLYGWLYGSSVTFGCTTKASAPGQVPVSELRRSIDSLTGGKRHIVLIGFMGVGKSTISRQLAEISGRAEVDTDALIVSMQGREITDIFAQEGEGYFRDLETELIDHLGSMDSAIISCGGGMAMRELNVKKLQAIGTIVLLTASPETIFERVRGSRSRPVLNGHMNVSYIRELMEKRRAFYEKAAELVISTDGLDKKAIAEQILKHF